MAAENKSSNTLSTLIIGLAVGAAIGVLFAPDKGSNTRARLLFKLSRYKEQLAELVEELESKKATLQGSEEYADTTNSVEELVDEVENLLKKIQSGKA